MAHAALSLAPSELVFDSVRFGQVYKQSIAVTNQTSSPVDLTFRVGSPERYSIHPKTARLKPGQTSELVLELKVLKFAQLEKAVKQGQRDIVHIKAPFFDQKFYTTFYLSPELLGSGSTGARAPAKAQTADPSQPAGSGTTQTTSTARASAGGKDAGDEARERRAVEAPGTDTPGPATQPIRLQRPTSPEALPTAAASSSVYYAPALPSVSAPAGFPASESGAAHYASSDSRGIQQAIAAAVSAAVERERQDQEARNARVLQLLQSKDGTIAEWQAKHERLSRQVHELEEAIAQEQREHASTAERLRGVEKRLVAAQSQAKAGAELERAKHVDRAEFEQLQQDLDAAQRRARAGAAAVEEVSDLKRQLARACADAVKADEERAAANEQSAELRRQLREVNERAVTAAKQLSEATAEAAKEAAQLRSSYQAQIAALEGQLQGAPGHAAAAVPSTVTISALAHAPASAGQHVAELTERVEALEAANAALERALLDAHGREARDTAATRSATMQDAELRQVRATLAERDGEVGRLRSELEILRAQRPALLPDVNYQAPVLPSSTGQIEQLRELLAQKESQITSNQTRIARLESLHKLAQESALKCEAELLECHNALARSEVDQQQLRAELDSSKATSAQLNARVSTLVAAEQTARSELSSTLAKLEGERAEHRQEVTAMQQAQARIRSSLEAVQAEQQAASTALAPDELPQAVTSVAPEQPQNVERMTAWAQERERMLEKQRAMKQAVEDAELAVAVMQKKLLDAQAECRQAQEEAVSVRRSADAMRGDLEQKVRSATEDGNLRVRLLEETVEQLSRRGGQHAELARLSAELSKTQRNEARLRSDLVFAQDRVEALTRELQDATTSISEREAEAAAAEAHQVRSILGSDAALEPAAASPGESDRLAALAQARAFAAEQRQHRELLAKTVERAEAAEIELGRVRNELTRLQHRRAAERSALAPGANAIVSASKALEVRAHDLERDNLVHDARIKSLTETVQMREAEVRRLEAQLAEATREVAAARSRVSDAERRAHDAHELAHRRSLESKTRTTLERAQITKRLAQAEGAQQDAEQRVQASEEQRRAAEVRASRLCGELEQAQSALARADASAAERIATLTEDLSASKAALARASGEADERKVQLMVVTDTVEALQSGQLQEREQRVVNLTAQLIACRTREVMSERRAAEAATHAAQQREKAAEAQGRCEASEGCRKQAVAEAASLRQQKEKLALEISTLRQEASELEAARMRALEAADAAEARFHDADSELRGAQEALQRAATRHFAQLEKERAAASTALRDAQSSALRVATQAGGASLPEPVYLSRMRARIGDLLRAFDEHREGSSPTAAAARGRLDDGGSAEPGAHDSWQSDVVRQMQNMVLEAEGERSRAVADARIASDDLVAATHRLSMLERAHEAALAREDAATTQVLAVKAQAANARERMSAQAAEICRASRARLEAVSEQLLKALASIFDLTGALQCAAEAEKKHLEELANVSATLAATQGETEALRAQRDGLQMELTGSPDAAGVERKRAVEMRDAAIKDYVVSRILPLVHDGDPDQKIMGLAREVCALKLVESQLLSSLAAANNNADTAERRIATLTVALTQLKAGGSAESSQLADDRNRCARQFWSGLGDGIPLGERHSIAELHSQLAAKEHEVFSLRSMLLEAKQETDRVIAELQAERNATEAARKEVAREKEAAAVSLSQQRADLSAEATRERDMLASELTAATARAAELARQVEDQEELLRQKLREAADAAAKEQQAAVAEALEASVPAEDLDQAHAEAAAAEERAEALGAEADDLRAQIDALSEALSSAQAEAAEARDAEQTSMAAVESLQATLGRIEKSVRRGAIASAPGGGAAAGADIKVGELSRQIVQSKLAEADAQRRLRVAARVELEMRTRLTGANERIEELKREVAAAKASRARSRGGQRVSLASRDARETIRSRGPSHFEIELLPQSADEAEGTEQAARSSPAPRAYSRGRSLASRRQSAPGVAEDPVLEGEPPSGPSQSGVAPNSAAALRVELAKRDAEVEYLQSALAEAISSGQQAGTLPELVEDAAEARRELHSSQQALSDMRAAAARCAGSLQMAVSQYRRALARDRGVDSSPREDTIAGLDSDVAASIVELSEQVLEFVQEREQRVWALQLDIRHLTQQLDESRNKAAGTQVQSLTVSQRAVITDLTAKNGALFAAASDLQQENARLQERLRVLRASVEAPGDAANEAGAAGPQSRTGRGTPRSRSLLPSALSRARPPRPGTRSPARAASPGAAPTAEAKQATSRAAVSSEPASQRTATGLAMLLHQHISELMASQRAAADVLADELQRESPHEQSPTGRNCRWTRFSVEGTDALLSISKASASELAAMDAALCVLLNDLESTDEAAAEADGRGGPGARSRQDGPGRSSPSGAHARSPLSALDNCPDAVPKHIAEAKERDLQRTQAELRDTRDHVEALEGDLTRSTARIRVLEHDARAMQTRLAELDSLRAELEEARSQCTEWHKRHTSSQLEAQKAASDAALLEADLRSQIAHAEAALQRATAAAQVDASRLKEGHEGELASLQERVRGLQDDVAREAAAHERTKEEATALGGRAAAAETQAEMVRQQLTEAQESASKAEGEVESLTTMLREEKAERSRIVDSLRSTIQRVRAAGHAEDELQSELMRLNRLLAAETSKRESCERMLTATTADLATTHAALSAARDEVAAVKQQLSEQQSALAARVQETTASLFEAQDKVLALEGLVTASHESVEAQLQRLGQGMLTATHHLGVPTSVLDEITALEAKAEVLESRIATVERDAAAAHAAARELATRHRHSDAAELVALQNELAECRLLADSEHQQLRTTLAVAKRDAELANTRAADFAAQLESAQQRANDARATDLGDRAALTQRHRAEMDELRTAHSAALQACHAAHDETRAQLADALAEAGTLHARVLAAEGAMQDALADRAALEERLSELTNSLRATERQASEELTVQLASVQQQFQNYQHAKAMEVAELEDRIRELIQGGAAPSTSAPAPSESPTRGVPSGKRGPAAKRKASGKQTAPRAAKVSIVARRGKRGGGAKGGPDDDAAAADVSEPAIYVPTRASVDSAVLHGPSDAARSLIQSAVTNDAVQAAQRELEFERLARQRTQAELTASEERLVQARERNKALQAQLREAQQHAVIARIAEQRAAQAADECNAVRNDLTSAQDALRTCRADAARKGALLKAAQERSEGASSASDAVAAEAAAHAETRERLGAAKAQLERRSALVAELRRKLEEAEQALSAGEGAASARAAADRQVKELQAALARKDQTIREVRDGCKASIAREVKAAVESARTPLDAAAKKLRADVVRKEALLAAAKAETEQAQAEASKADETLRKALAKEMTAVRSAKADAAAKAGLLGATLNAVAILTRLVLRGSAVLRLAASSIDQAGKAIQGLHEAAPSMRSSLAADQIARMVGLSAQDVSDLMSSDAPAPSADTLAGGTAVLAHIASILFALNSHTDSASHGTSDRAFQQSSDDKLASLLAVLRSELQKAEVALEGRISDLPGIVEAAGDKKGDDCSKAVQQALRAMPLLSATVQSVESLMTSALQGAGAKT